MTLVKRPHYKFTFLPVEESTCEEGVPLAHFLSYMDRGPTEETARMKGQRIDTDHMAGTPVVPEVVEAMRFVLKAVLNV